MIVRIDDDDVLTQLRADQVVLSKLAPYARSHGESVRCYQLLQRLESDISQLVLDQAAQLLHEAGLGSRAPSSSVRRCMASHRSVCH